MANSKQAKRRVKQAQRDRDNNRWQLTRARSAVKKAFTAAEEKNLDEARELAKQATSYLDKLANKGIIHKNKAARHKRQLSAAVKAA